MKLTERQSVIALVLVVSLFCISRGVVAAIVHQFDGRVWSVGSDQSNGREHITEYVLPKETLENYHELVTHQLYSDPEHEIKVPTLLTAIRNGFGPDCGAFTWKVLTRTDLHAVYAWSHAGCKQYPAQYEISRVAITREGISRWSYASRVVPVSLMKQEEWRRIVEALPDDLPADAEIRRLHVSGGGTILHAFVGDAPLPAVSPSAMVSSAGPAFVRENGSLRLNWIAVLEPNEEAAFNRINRIVLEEVSAAKTIPLFSGLANRRDNGIFIQAPGQLVSRQTYPWVYTPDSTLLVFRITLARSDASFEVLWQPVLIGAQAKQTIRAHLK